MKILVNIYIAKYFDPFIFQLFHLFLGGLHIFNSIVTYSYIELVGCVVYQIYI